MSGLGTAMALHMPPPWGLLFKVEQDSSRPWSRVNLQEPPASLLKIPFSRSEDSFTVALISGPGIWLIQDFVDLSPPLSPSPSLRLSQLAPLITLAHSLASFLGPKGLA